MVWLFMPLIVLLSAIWAAVDASSVTGTKNLAKGPGGYSPAEWFFAVALLWIVAFPLYLVRRGDALRRDRLTDEEREQELERLKDRRHPASFALAILLILLGGIFGFAMIFNEAWHIVVLCAAAVVVGTLLLAKTQKAAVIALLVGVAVAGVAYYLPRMIEGREEVSQEATATLSPPTADLPNGAVVVSRESQQEIQREFANAKARVEELREACVKVEQENQGLKEQLVSTEARNLQIQQEMVKYRDGLNRAVAELNRLDAANKRLSSMVRDSGGSPDQ